jgi:hypothetical protein
MLSPAQYRYDLLFSTHYGARRSDGLAGADNHSSAEHLRLPFLG